MAENHREELANASAERSMLGPLVPGPEQSQRRRRALLVSMAAQLVLIALLALWPQPRVIPYRPQESTMVRLDWPQLSLPAPQAPTLPRFDLPVRRSRPVAARQPQPLWRHLMEATTDPTLTRPRLAPQPGPLRAPAPSVVATISPAPKFPAPAAAAAAPVELHQFAAATTKLALQPSPGAVKPSGFGGPQSQSITVQASGPVRLAGFAGPDRPAAVAAASGGGVQTGNFGTALATGASGLHGTAAGPVASAGFDLTALPPLTAAAAGTSAEPAYIPVEILFKPVPEYSTEGRQLGIQGEVVLAVLFQINGQLRVARVVHSLGHGLDEAAIRAAQEIRFRPAQRNGAPIETAALIRVTFQLAQ